MMRMLKALPVAVAMVVAAVLALGAIGLVAIGLWHAVFDGSSEAITSGALSVLMGALVAWLAAMMSGGVRL